ncbi:MAG: ABC-type transport auxiliary lipoprotein family protein, partial [Gammaproteobacteria bacterium]|nr:ABC-type transport auxiliary lipoprotein family protein [Gammaproteobacteria bacterium]
MLKSLRLTIILFIVALLSACSLGSPVTLPTVASYTVTNTAKTAFPRYNKTRYTVLMAEPIAAPGYQTSAMVYMQTPFRLKAFARHRWVAPPSLLLLPVLANQLRSRGYFATVVTPPFTGNTDYRVDTRLQILRQEFLRPQSQLRLVMQAFVIDNHNQKVIGSREFQNIINVTAKNPYAGVLATNRAASQLAKRMANFVVAVVRRNAPKPKPVVKVPTRTRVKPAAMPAPKKTTTLPKPKISQDPPAVPVHVNSKRGDILPRWEPG